MSFQEVGQWHSGHNEVYGAEAGDSSVHSVCLGLTESHSSLAVDITALGAGLESADLFYFCCCSFVLF